MGHANRPFLIKQFDLLPVVSAQLVEEADGDPIDLGSASQVAFHWRATGANQGLGTGIATTTNASQGQVEYHWTASQTATEGYFQAEFVATYASGKCQTVPNRGYIPVVVGDDIA